MAHDFLRRVGYAVTVAPVTSLLDHDRDRPQVHRLDIIAATGSIAGDGGGIINSYARKKEMNPVPGRVIERFAEIFCFGRTGLSREEIPLYFAKYQGDVPTLVSQMGMAKNGVFVACVQALTPSNQRLSLYDLCDSPPASRHPMPKEEARLDLLKDLVQADGRSPLGVHLSQMTLSGIREHWFTAASRIPGSIAGAITAGRSLVESTCRTILAERGQVDESAGDLGKLYKHTRQALGIDPKQGASQNVHQLASGLTQVIDGIAGLSNKAGDRHGLESGGKIEEASFASLAVHAAGTVSLFLARVHRETSRGPT